jgi:cholesterol transport system auxiliary component
MKHRIFPMKTKFFLIGLLLLLAGCGGMRALPAPQLYDLGLARPLAGLPALPPLAMADADAPAWLDTPLIYYRLAYANERQARAYANSRWSMPPADLFAQRLKSRIAQAGGVVLAPNSGVSGVPVLRLELDEFGQVFEQPDRSVVLISLRLSVLDGRRLIGQKSFMRQAPADSADAPGAIAALGELSDALIPDMLAWLSTLPLAAQ